jgi:hypothetical protein
VFTDTFFHLWLDDDQARGERPGVVVKKLLVIFHAGQQNAISEAPPVII